MIADFDPLWQEIDQVWDAARPSREYTRMAHAHAILTLQQIQRAYRRALTACMTPSMPTANAWTREITATILASHGLLDETPGYQAFRRRVVTGDPPGRREAGRDDDGRVS